MKRMKRRKIKEEALETPTSRCRDKEQHDLAYYIHDRVELMHQVFSVIKPKELKAMAPECVYHISVDDLQELCTEELLGISSKRLCAILDGADPPTDTESSGSEPNIETISLDSISSDDEVLSQHSPKRKHKHKKHKSRSKHKHRSSKSSDKGDQETREEEDRSRASRAGLTVLELLELQARARAIRAQLQQDNAHVVPKQTETQQNNETSEDEIEIKEEPAEVVEISSEDEKPKVEDPPAKPPSPSKHTPGNSESVTKIIKDLTVTVPTATPRKKIVLNRNRTVTTARSDVEVSTSKDRIDKGDATKPKTSTDTASKAKAISPKEKVAKIGTQEKSKVSVVKTKVQSKFVNNKLKPKKKQKKKDKSDKEEDHDEITLQLSDTEKMDLLEDLDRKNYENFTSSSEDSESSSGNSENDTSQDSSVTFFQEKDNVASISHETNAPMSVNVVTTISDDIDMLTTEKEGEVQQQLVAVEIKAAEKHVKETEYSDMNAKEVSEEDTNENVAICNSSNFAMDENINTCMSSDKIMIIELDSTKSQNVEVETSKITDANTILENQCTNTTAVQYNKKIESSKASSTGKDLMESHQAIKSTILKLRNDNFNELEANGNMETVKNANETDTNECISTNESIESMEEGEITNTDKDLSEGEIVDQEEETLTISTETLNKSDVVSLPDDDIDKQKKKKKKEKKTKKEKKSKKEKLDFRKGADQNFFKKDLNRAIIQKDAGQPGDQEKTECNTRVVNIHEQNNESKDDAIVSLDDGDDDNIYEILEISDDSSCYEVEGISVSIEPTAAELAALSAKIDEIHQNDIVTINEDEYAHIHGENNEGLEHNITNNENISEELENASWRERYLGSKRVKRVLTTSNMLNALRKKNKELKKKLEESKQKIRELKEVDKPLLAEVSDVAEGSIEHFNTLQESSNKVEPVASEVPKEANQEEGKNEEVTKDMKKDAKQLLKMYKRLLKYNDINKKKDSKKKKKKKHKKNKEKDADANVQSNVR